MTARPTVASRLYRLRASPSWHWFAATVLVALFCLLAVMLPFIISGWH